MDQSQMRETSNTGTRDSTYNLTAVLYHALQGVENTAIYLKDADGEQRQFLQMAHDQQRQIAEQAKRLLHDALMRETQGGEMKDRESGFGRDRERGEDTNVATSQSHSFEEARDDNSAFRFASERTEGGSDQFGQGSSMDRQDEVMPRSGQRSDQATTDDGGTSRF